MDVSIFKSVLDDIGKEVKEIQQTHQNKIVIGRKILEVIGEKLLEFEEAASEGETEQDPVEHENCDDKGNCIPSTVLESFQEETWWE